MRRVVLREHGGPGALQVEEAPRPEPGAGQVLLEVAAIGVTLPVVRLVHGEPEVPHLPGGEVAGRVVAIGSGVTGWQVGQRAVGIAFTGGYAEFAVVPAPFLTPIPDAADDAAAVALVRSGQVALGALRAANPQPGESVLVTGAAGGVGHLAVQLARELGPARSTSCSTGSAAMSRPPRWRCWRRSDGSCPTTPTVPWST
ncbi:alcohol dehydrogenase catalytic domain-containing protein [Actinocrispum sp. NPDC049592]|uniref:quinone oxidoreductase family protein n=1 Tax=Actinocrispum sp. NPDC049592 TaxID=3154835 RepID=UPI00341E9555